MTDQVKEMKDFIVKLQFGKPQRGDQVVETSIRAVDEKAARKLFTDHKSFILLSLEESKLPRYS